MTLVPARVRLCVRYYPHCEPGAVCGPHGSSVGSAQFRATQKRPVGADAYLAGAPQSRSLALWGEPEGMERAKSSPQAGTQRSGISSGEGKHRVRLYAARTRRGYAPAPPTPRGPHQSPAQRV